MIAFVNCWQYETDEFIPVVRAIKGREAIKQTISANGVDYINVEPNWWDSRTLIQIRRRDAHGYWKQDVCLDAEYIDGKSDEHLVGILAHLCQEFVNGVRDSVQVAGGQ